MSVFSFKAFAQSDHILWYDHPATYFEESLVLGNGKWAPACSEEFLQIRYF